GRARSGTLNPRDVQQQQTDTTREPERRAAVLWSCSHPVTNHKGGRDRQHADHEESKCGRNPEERPRPKPAATSNVRVRERSRLSLPSSDRSMALTALASSRNPGAVDAPDYS